MKTSNPSVVPLRQASLCLDCEMITVAPTSCPACGSVALLNVSRALSRPGLEGVCGPERRAIPAPSANYPGQDQAFFRHAGPAAVRAVRTFWDSRG